MARSGPVQTSSLRRLRAAATDSAPARVISSLWRGFRDDDVTGLAAELSYRWLLAIFPLVIMTGAFAGLASDALGFDDPTEQLVDALSSTLPPEAVATLRPQIERVLGSQDGGLLSLGLALTIIAASAGMRALIKGSNRVYRVAETRAFWRQTVVALLMTVIAGLGAIASVSVVSVGQVTAERIAGLLGVGAVVGAWLEAATVPLAIVLMLALVIALYRVAPARKAPFRWLLPGAALFVPVWLLGTWLFSLYVANFGSYSDVYGALAGVIILLLWFYITAILLLIGGELNAALEDELGDRSTAPVEVAGVPALSSDDRPIRSEIAADDPVDDAAEDET